MNELTQSLPGCSCHLQVITKPIASHQIMWGVMTINICGELCPGSKCFVMVLRNLSAWEVCIPPKTVIGNVQTATKVPDREVLSHTGGDLPTKEQEELSKVWPD